MRGRTGYRESLTLGLGSGRRDCCEGGAEGEGVRTGRRQGLCSSYVDGVSDPKWAVRRTVKSKETVVETSVGVEGV